MGNQFFRDEFADELLSRVAILLEKKPSWADREKITSAGLDIVEIVWSGNADVIDR